MFLFWVDAVDRKQMNQKWLQPLCVSLSATDWRERLGLNPVAWLCKYDST